MKLIIPLSIGLFVTILITGCAREQNSSFSFTEPPFPPPVFAPDKSPSEVKPPSQTPNIGPSITLRIDFGDGTIPLNLQFLISNFQTPLLWPIMQQALAENGIAVKYDDYGGELGVLITKIGDKKNGDEGKYWQYFVNGKYAKVGVSGYKVRTGDVIEWRFTKSFEF